MAEDPAPCCSFCAGQEPVRHLVTGPKGVVICEACVDLCAEVLAYQRGARHGGNEYWSWFRA
ncbi:MAG TPA: ClpX C4-type zinc finger protein [Gammaproteobacteria bacterium]|nr:ClpX C4-type zinc finger protein [Gammaproteobacteria bacterium]